MFYSPKLLITPPATAPSQDRGQSYRPVTSAFSSGTNDDAKPRRPMGGFKSGSGMNTSQGPVCKGCG